MLPGVRIVFAPSAAVLAVTFVGGGVALGTVSGLVPGLHANNFALFLAAAAPAVPGPGRFVGAAMLAAGVTHTFLDVVPALALGVPDPAMAASALPGHRLVLAGRGREALRLSALGSGLAVVAAAPLAVPVTELMAAVYPSLRARLPLVLVGVAVTLVATERTRRARFGCAAGLAASAALGLVVLDLPATGLVDAGGLLAPLFAGLFGAPVLVESLGGEGVPAQSDAGVTSRPRAVVGVAAAGTLAGAAVGYLPGVSSAVAATVALLAVPRRIGARGFVVTTSAVNTANAVFALFALLELGTPRTGVLVALDDAAVPLSPPLLLGGVALAAAAGFVLVVTAGDRYLRTVGRLDNTRLSLAVLALLAVVSFLFAGPVGVGAFLLAGIVGLVPARAGARRASLMGVLMGPLIVGG
ncbi:hypothetical protein BRC83_00995 [Halobacteriales archaeon QS_1_68_17]|nr:MAG: hypothetical protein BRC83_00995 [Halobacteriales archaeon QS_1_68_17]